MSRSRAAIDPRSDRAGGGCVVVDAVVFRG
jgi:hypothetical protein